MRLATMSSMETLVFDSLDGACCRRRWQTDKAKKQSKMKTKAMRTKTRKGGMPLSVGASPANPSSLAPTGGPSKLKPRFVVGTIGLVVEALSFGRGSAAELSGTSMKSELITSSDVETLAPVVEIPSIGGAKEGNGGANEGTRMGAVDEPRNVVRTIGPIVEVALGRGFSSELRGMSNCGYFAVVVRGGILVDERKAPDG